MRPSAFFSEGDRRSPDEPKLFASGVPHRADKRPRAIGLPSHYAQEPGAKTRRLAIRRELVRRVEKAPLISCIPHDLEVSNLRHVFENFHGRVRGGVLL